jgi:hypothetical protein
MYQQLWGYKVEEKLYLGVREQKGLNTTGTEDLSTNRGPDECSCAVNHTSGAAQGGGPRPSQDAQWREIYPRPCPGYSLVARSVTSQHGVTRTVSLATRIKFIQSSHRYLTLVHWLYPNLQNLQIAITLHIGYVLTLVRNRQGGV